MSLDDFVSKWNNQHADFDGFAGSQCKDLFSYYNRDVVGNPNYVMGDAWQLYDNAPSEYYDKVLNTTTGVPPRGAIVIWKQSYGGFGHVVVFLDGDANSFNAFSQNYPVLTKLDSNNKVISKGTPCSIQHFNYSKVKGWLIAKNSMNTFTPGQARRLYQIIGRREPENEQVLQNRGWELVEGLGQGELDPYISNLIGAKNTAETIVELNKGIIEANVKQIKGMQTLLQNNQIYMDKQDVKIKGYDIQIEEMENDLIIKLADKDKQIEAAKNVNLKGLSFWQRIMLLFG